MSRLTVRLPETLHQQLVNLAQTEGISLNQYIVYCLTRQVENAYTIKLFSEEEIKQQNQSFSHLLQELGETDDKTIQTILDQREEITPNNESERKIIEQLNHKINQAKSISNA
ncbi:MAG: DUF6290 family protein [Microcystaceae cyanobacterium]